LIFTVVSLAVDLLGGFSVGNVKLERPGASALLGTKEEAKGLSCLEGVATGDSSVTLLLGETSFNSTLA
jgi:hypothetical protein